MANYNLTNQDISQSFQQLLQIDSGSALRDGTGSLVGNLTVTSSYATQALTSSYALQALSASYAVSASYEIIKEVSSSYADTAPWNGILNKPAGLVSGSSQLTSSYDQRYVLSGSVQPLPPGVVSGSSQIDFNGISNVPSGLVSSSTQVSFNGITDVPSGLVSSSEQLILSASQITFNSASTDLSSSNVQDALKELDMVKAPISALSSNLIIYPTTATSSIAGYSRLVTSPDDEGYNTTAVNIPTGPISGSNQFISALATTGSLFTGNPGVINITTLGNVRRTAGGNDSSADFYFEVYKRSGSVETLIATSTNTAEVNAETYEQFYATALLNNGIFTADDILITKYYGNLVNAGGQDPEFDFQFGGEEPVRTLIPVPASVITDPTLTLRVDSLEQFSGSINQFTQSQEELNNTFATTGSNNFVGNQDVNGIVSSTQNQSNIHYNPQLITDNVTIPTGQNGIIIGETTISGDLTIEGNSEVFFYTQPPLTEYLTTASYLVDSASFDTRINQLDIDTGSFAKTNVQNVFTAAQKISGSLNLYHATEPGFDGLYFNSGSKNLFMGTSGFSSPDQFIVSAGGNTMEINLNSGWYEYYTTVNFNSQVNSRGSFGVRSINQDSTYTASLERVELNTLMKLTPQDPLPAGALGEVAVSGSVLYFHDGTNWRIINLT